MALDERDREDLLRDGRNLSVRGQCMIDHVKVVIGFRAKGQLSLFCGADPVFQFNAERRLRRVFFRGRRFAADKGHLVELIRPSRGGKVEFVSQPVDAATHATILSSVERWLQKIRHATEDETARWEVIQPGGTSLLETLRDWLQHTPGAPDIAAVPNA